MLCSLYHLVSMLHFLGALYASLKHLISVEARSGSFFVWLAPNRGCAMDILIAFQVVNITKLLSLSRATRVSVISYQR